MVDVPIEYHYVIDHQKIAREQLESLSHHILDKDWMLYDYFGCLYVINLPESKDRLEIIKNDLKGIGVGKFDVLPAVNGRTSVPEEIWKKMKQNWAKYDLSTESGRKKFKSQRQGETGCYLSHLNLIKLVKKRFDKAIRKLQRAILAGDHKAIKAASTQARKYSSVVILEDDNGFGIVAKNKQKASLNKVGKLFRKAMAELPKDWDMCYFMAWSRRPEKKISPYSVKLRCGLYNNAYAVNHKFYSEAIALLERIYDPKVTHVQPLDAEFGDIHHMYKCYAVTPAIAYQKGGVSNITSHSWKRFRQIQPIYKNGIQKE
jgi:GR25 family glycosyltransferase involved in LPS biosynthesis